LLSLSQTSPELPYFIDFSWFARAVLSGNKGRLSPDGSLLINYGPLVGRQRNPTSQAILTLGLMQMWRQTKDEGTLSLASKTANALLKLAQSTQDDSLAFPVTFKPFGYRLKTPFFSALSQGFSASVFSRIYALTHDPAWLEYGARSLDLVVKNPNLACPDLKGGGIWYEEYPTSPPLHVLNGHIYCTVAFREVGMFAGYEKYTRFFEMGVDAVVGNLSSFDMNGLSYYDAARRTLAKPYYQKLHVEQLRFLQRVSGNAILEAYANKWEKRMVERWGLSTWLRYLEGTLMNGYRAEGPAFPIKALPYLLGEG